MIYYTYLVIPTHKGSKFFGTVYFGKHKTEKLDDGYIASGKKIVDYLKKYPKEYYREIIKYYSSEEELNKAEYDLIHPHLNKSYCLNLIEGGQGGSVSDDIRKILSYQKLGNKNPQYGKLPWNKGLKMSEEFCKHCSEAQKGNTNKKGKKKKVSK